MMQKNSITGVHGADGSGNAESADNTSSRNARRLKKRGPSDDRLDGRQAIVFAQ